MMKNDDDDDSNNIQTSKPFNTKFCPQWKDKKCSYQLRQIFRWDKTIKNIG